MRKTRWMKMWAVFSDGSVLFVRRTRREAKEVMGLFKDEGILTLDLHLEGPYLLRGGK